MNETFTYPKLVFTISKAKIAFFEYQSQIREQISSPNLQVFIVKFFGFKKYIMQLFSADAIVSEKVKKLLIIGPDPLFHSPTQTTAHSPELFCFVTEEILYSITAVSDQGSYAKPLCYWFFLTPRQALSSHPDVFIMILWESMNFHPD